MTKPPAFQFYAKDIYTGTSDLSRLEFGVYVTGLAWSWDNGPLPLDPTRRARVLLTDVRECAAVWPVISGMWRETPNGFVNDRLERLREEQRKYSERQSRRGTSGAESRWHKYSRDDGTGNISAIPEALAQAQPDNGSAPAPAPASASPICNLQSADQKPRAKAARASVESPYDASFHMRFWPAYPRKTAKPEALKAWRKLTPDLDTIAAIEASLQWQCRQATWTKENGEYIPHPATWLNQRRWEDEPFEAARPSIGSPEYHARSGDWFEECQRLHAGRCNGSSGHRTQLLLDETHTESA